MWNSRPLPNKVFTPRAPVVNGKMYISRDEQEKALSRALMSNYCIVIYGDSGCGKSWLYKRAFSELGVSYSILDLNSCKNRDDVDLKILDKISKLEEYVEEGKSEERELDVRPLRMGAKQKQSFSFKKNNASAFYRLCDLMAAQKSYKKGVIVFENVEHIIDNEDLMEFIRSMILEIDNPDYAARDISICVVGVPYELSAILTSGNVYQTISNRIYEVPEVGRLTPRQADQFMRRGFIETLKYDVEHDFDLCCRAIATATDRVPQYLHDVCLQVALAAEEGDFKINQEIVEKGIADWIISSDKHAFGTVDQLISKDKSNERVKSKIIFCLSQLEDPYFSKSDISDSMEKYFPKYCAQQLPQLTKVLNGLSSGPLAILKMSKDKTHYQIRTPALRGALRSALTLSMEGEDVRVRRLKHSGLAYDENYPKSVQW